MDGAMSFLAREMAALFGFCVGEGGAIVGKTRWSVVVLDTVGSKNLRWYSNGSVIYLFIYF